MLEQNFQLIYEVVHGSQAFGLDGPESDLDLKGIIAGPPSWYSGFLPSPEQLIINKDHTLCSSSLAGTLSKNL